MPQRRPTTKEVGRAVDRVPHDARLGDLESDGSNGQDRLRIPADVGRSQWTFGLRDDRTAERAVGRAAATSPGDVDGKAFVAQIEAWVAGPAASTRA